MALSHHPGPRLMAESLFPDRQRCRKCSKGLGATGAPVFNGLFCSARCAGLAELHTDPEQAPRQCKTLRGGRWEFKVRYRSVGEIPAPVRDDPSANWYWCGHCGALHIGHSRIDLAQEQFRMLASAEDLADLLVKLRGHATRKQVAEVAGIRPIRLKELEEPGTAERVDLGALFKVLGTYRTRAGVALRTTSRA
jgi:hypothetical protein